MFGNVRVNPPATKSNMMPHLEEIVVH